MPLSQKCQKRTQQELYDMQMERVFFPRYQLSAHKDFKVDKEEGMGRSTQEKVFER